MIRQEMLGLRLGRKVGFSREQFRAHGIRDALPGFLPLAFRDVRSAWGERGDQDASPIISGKATLAKWCLNGSGFGLGVFFQRDDQCVVRAAKHRWVCYRVCQFRPGSTDGWTEITPGGV